LLEPLFKDEEGTEIDIFECEECEYKVCDKCKKEAFSDKLLIEKALDMLKSKGEIRTHYEIEDEKREELKLPIVMCTEKVIRWFGPEKIWGIWDDTGKELPISKEDTLVPPLSGYSHKQVNHDMKISYVRLNQSQLA
jgi:hypothetical protein